MILRLLFVKRSRAVNTNWTRKNEQGIEEHLHLWSQLYGQRGPRKPGPISWYKIRIYDSKMTLLVNLQDSFAFGDCRVVHFPQHDFLSLSAYRATQLMHSTAMTNKSSRLKVVPRKLSTAMSWWENEIVLRRSVLSPKNGDGVIMYHWIVGREMKDNRSVSYAWASSESSLKP